MAALPLAAAALALLLAAVPIPTLRARVTDQAGVLPAEARRDLEARLEALERSDSTQVVVLIVRTTGEMAIEDYALEVGRKNQIGQAGKSNGAVLVVAVDDRTIRIEVGEGLEGRLPDSVAALIMKHEMVPRLRQGDVAGGVCAGVDAIIRAVKGEYTAPPAARGAARRRPGQMPPEFAVFIAIVAVVSFVFRAMRRRLWAFGLVPAWAALGTFVFGFPLLLALGASVAMTLVGLFAQPGGVRRHGYGRGRGVVFGGGFGGSRGFGGFSGGGGRFSGGGASASW